MTTAHTRDIPVDRGEHIVQFYDRESQLVAMVGPYLLAGADAGETAIVIATGAHRRAFEAELQAGGIDVVQARADGSLIVLDAASTMEAFITGAEIDHDAFDAVIGGLLRRASLAGRPIRAYGEMVALLWDAGDVLAAIELEGLWNELAREVRFSLFCSYPAASVAGSEHAEALHKVCHLHSSVVQDLGALEEAVAGRHSPRELSASFPAERDSPARARRLVIEALQGWGHGDALVDEVALVLSELASNAVIHARSAFSITLRAQDSTVHLAVEDALSPSANARGGGLVARAGHGLDLIEALAARWGVEATPAGKLVWAELRPGG
jgi:hypothetical protein